MVVILIALRDFFVAVLISWLGIVSEPADHSAQTENVAPANAQISALL